MVLRYLSVFDTKFICSFYSNVCCVAYLAGLGCGFEAWVATFSTGHFNQASCELTFNNGQSGDSTSL